MENTITITVERFQELLKKEIVFDIKKAEFEASSYKSTADTILFELTDKSLKEMKDDDL